MTVDWIPEAVAGGLDASVLELHLQPIVVLESGQVTAAESFIRWRDPHHGLVPPRDWMPLAESTGAIVGCAMKALPMWVACSARFTGRMVSFNLGGRQLLDAGFMAALRDLPPEVAAGLALEIPYLQFSIDHANRVQPEWSWNEIPDLRERLGELHALGFSVWLDDYDGTIPGDEFLSLPEIDVVKLDRSLLDHDPRKLTELVEGIHSHSKRTLIEGVEHHAHRDLALNAGIALAQGFLYGAPAKTP